MEKLKRKYGSKKKQIKEAMNQVDLLEKLNNEFKEKIILHTEQVNYFI